MNRQKFFETGYIQALVDLNDNILPGFANETIQRLGLGPSQALYNVYSTNTTL